MSSNHQSHGSTLVHWAISVYDVDHKDECIWLTIVTRSYSDDKRDKAMMAKATMMRQVPIDNANNELLDLTRDRQRLRCAEDTGFFRDTGLKGRKVKLGLGEM